VIVSLIVAMDEANGIGRDGKLPWHLSDDLQRFKRLTMGHHLVMGRLTYESIGRILPGRTTIVVTRRGGYSAPGCLVVNSVESALALARSRGETEAFIIGGGQIFAQSLHLADRIHLTRVHTYAACDVFFPEFDLSAWQEKGHYFQPADNRNDYSFTYCLLIHSPS
jgi:dihydrofolate reductase